MADNLTRVTDRPPVPDAPITIPTETTGVLRRVGDPIAAPGTVRTRDDLFPGAITTPTTGLPGSSLDTLYGINSGTYLTSEQRKLAQQIQGKFDASVNSRDRALAQYGAPRLSSFVEDEALARAMSLAGGLNYRAPDTTTAYPRSARGGVPGTGGTRFTTPTPVTPTGPSSGAQNAASWQRVLAGLSSIIPLLFGRDAYGQLLNKGLIQSVKDYLFGPGSQISDTQLQQVIQQGGLPTQGPLTLNPITGEPMQLTGWEDQAAAAPWGASAEGGAPYPTPDWWTTPDTSSWDFTGGWDYGSLAGP